MSGWILKVPMALPGPSDMAGGMRQLSEKPKQKENGLSESFSYRPAFPKKRGRLGLMPTRMSALLS
jgi:hypothetical protein